MRTKLFYALSALVMVAMMFATSCSKDDPTPDTKPQNYTVTFNANGGAGTMTVQEIEEETATALTTNAFTRTGYTFSGWNTAAGGGGTSYANGANITLSADETLYAQWTKDAVVAESVSLNKEALSLVEGKAETLVATVNPNDATNKNVTWKSSNPAVATVVNGVVTAVKKGTATITVTTVDGSKTDTCTVTVKAPTGTNPPDIGSGGEF